MTESLNESMSNTAVCRTAPAPPGLLIMFQFSVLGDCLITEFPSIIEHTAS